MSHDLEMAAQGGLIATAYLWFAIHCVAFTRGERSQAQWALLALTSVFVLCAFNGYVAPTLAKLLPVKPDWLEPARYWGHWVLTAAAWAMALSAAPRVIARALAGDAASGARSDG
jgi:hypothetical protein